MPAPFPHTRGPNIPIGPIPAPVVRAAWTVATGVAGLLLNRAAKKKEQSETRNAASIAILATVRRELVNEDGSPQIVGKRLSAAGLMFTFEPANGGWNLEVEDNSRRGDDPERVRRYFYTKTGTALRFL